MPNSFASAFARSSCAPAVAVSAPLLQLYCWFLVSYFCFSSQRSFIKSSQWKMCGSITSISNVLHKNKFAALCFQLNWAFKIHFQNKMKEEKRARTHTREQRARDWMATRCKWRTNNFKLNVCFAFSVCARLRFVRSFAKTFYIELQIKITWLESQN